MKRWLLALAGVAIAARALGGERIADAIRWADQRLELFSPRGAGMYARVAPRILTPLYRTVASAVAEARAHHMVDVGTGPGTLAIEIARRCPRGEVIGVDLAPEMLATAGARAAEAGVADRVEECFIGGGRSARLNGELRGALTQCAAELDSVRGTLRGDAARYLGRLQQLMAPLTTAPGDRSA